MKRLGIFVDTTNMYKMLNSKFGRKLDYKRYIDFLSEIGSIDIMLAYGVTFEGVSNTFEGVLQRMGFTTRILQIPESKRKFFYEYRLDAQIAIDVIVRQNAFDMLVLGSTHMNTLPILYWAKSQNIPTLVFASGINSAITSVATQTIEIMPSVLEGSYETAKNAEP